MGQVTLGIRLPDVKIDYSPRLADTTFVEPCNIQNESARPSKDITGLTGDRNSVQQTHFFYWIHKLSQRKYNCDFASYEALQNNCNVVFRQRTMSRGMRTNPSLAHGKNNSQWFGSLRSWQSHSMRWTVVTGAILYWWQMGDWGLVTKLWGGGERPPSVSHTVRRIEWDRQLHKLLRVRDGSDNYLQGGEFDPAPPFWATRWRMWHFLGSFPAVTWNVRGYRASCLHSGRR